MPGPPAFRAGVGESLARGAVAAYGAWLLVRIALRAPAAAGLLAGGAAAAWLLVPAVARRRRGGVVRVGDEGLEISGGASREVLRWESLGAPERELRGARGTRGERLSVPVVRVSTAAGGALLLGDFAACGGVASPADAHEQVLDVENADALAAWIALRRGGATPPPVAGGAGAPRRGGGPVCAWAGVGTLALLAVRCVDSLWDAARAPWSSALGGLGAAAAGAVGGAFVSARARQGWRAGACAGACLAAVALALCPGVAADARAFALALALALALPSWPLPGLVLPLVAVSRTPARAAAGLAGVSLALAAALLLRGMTLLPAALLAALLAAHDHARARRRAAQWPECAMPPTMRVPVLPGCPELDAPPHRPASADPLPARALAATLAAALTLTALLARALLHGQPAASAVLRTFLG